MKILIICGNNLYKDPASSFIHNQAAALAQLGHQVDVLVSIPVGKRSYLGRLELFPRRSSIDGVTIHFLPFISFSNFGNAELNLASRTFFSWMFRIQSKFSPDCILVHFITDSLKLGNYLNKKWNVPLVVIGHGFDLLEREKAGKLSEIKEPCDQASQVVTVSSSLADRVRASGTDTPVRTILNGFQLSNVCAPCRTNPHSVIQVGKLSKQKRVYQTIAAFAQVKAGYPDAVLTIVGDGPERRNLEEQCRMLGIADSVHFLGYCPNRDALQAMAKHTVFVMPSVREGFGIVYLEAMASGCLVIGTQGEGIADFIRDGENGFLIPPESPNAIAKQIRWCFEHPDERARIAQQGQQEAMAQTWEKNALEYQALFTNLLKGC